MPQPENVPTFKAEVVNGQIHVKAIREEKKDPQGNVTEVIMHVPNVSLIGDLKKKFEKEEKDKKDKDNK